VLVGCLFSGTSLSLKPLSSHGPCKAPMR
jgi:hypothetical protein